MVYVVVVVINFWIVALEFVEFSSVLSAPPLDFAVPVAVVMFLVAVVVVVVVAEELTEKVVQTKRAEK